MLKTNVIWPAHRQFKSKTEWEPIGFFSECLCNASSFDLMLGFFSSSAIQILSDGFAMFLYNGGHMRLIINDVLTKQDKDFISKGHSTKDISFFDIENLEEVKKTLSIRDGHFYDCLSWLVRNKRIEIKIIRPKTGIGISHTKTGVFRDGIDSISFDGSCNFSQTALVENIESITASCDWDGSVECAKIKHTQEMFDFTFSEQDDSVIYVNADNIEGNLLKCFSNKDIKTLLEEEYEILNENSIFPPSFSNNIKYSLKRTKERLKATIELIKEKEETVHISENDANPVFPYGGSPRDYQIEAFEKWKNNNQKGLFAMATGTGKTITSLNCLLNIYKKTGVYKCLILVPTTVLVEQWEKECKKFKFEHITKVYSKNSNWKKDIDSIILQESINKENKISYVIIATYSSFARDNVFKLLIKMPKRKVLLIADEAHNMGAGKIKIRLSAIPYLRRIGLSATPQRQFDDSGNKAINDFFGISNNYTFEYSMKKAIDEGRLCQYYYYPHIVLLTQCELDAYLELSAKIVKFYNPDTDSFSKDDILMALLLKRKRIIHKAENKKQIFREILAERLRDNVSLKYTLVYAPEGLNPDEFNADDYDSYENIPDDPELSHLIDDYTRIVAETDSHTTVKQFTSDTTERENILKDFSEGKIDVLTSMKCLDEGVDVPRSEMAVFCASTGNPRQFVQRRGRILRTHKDKHFAIIHDMVVVPQIDIASSSYNMERNLVNNEMRRVREFADLAENSSYTISAMEDVLDFYNLPTF